MRLSLIEFPCSRKATSTTRYKLKAFISSLNGRILNTFF